MLNISCIVVAIWGALCIVFYSAVPFHRASSVFAHCV